MPSPIWQWDPQEAFASPYEYAIQEQFVREAKAVLGGCYSLLASDLHRYTAADRSAAKAVWLLHMDALDALRDALDALQRKRHRVAGRLFRDVMETLDLAAYFHEGQPQSTASLAKWYEDEIVPHSVYRDHIKRTEGKAAADKKRDLYRNLSKFTHRSYRAILEGYSLGAEYRLVHDRIAVMFGEGDGADTDLVLPQTIASYYATLADCIRLFLVELPRRGTATEADVARLLQSSLEKETAKRRAAAWLVEVADAQRVGD